MDCGQPEKFSVSIKCLKTYSDNYVNKRHKTDATRPSTTNRSDRRTSNGTAAPSSLPSPSSLPQSPPFDRDAPAVAPAHTAGIFEDISSRPGYLVDSLTRSGSFVFLNELFDNERLLELRDFRITRVMTKGEGVDQFTVSMHLVLDLTDKYPHVSLTTHILDYVV